MRVENHTGHIQKIPVMGASTGGNVIEADAVVLLPGVNDIDPAKWDKVKDIALIKAYIERGHRRAGIVVGDPKISLKTLEGLKAKEAVQTVEDTVDSKLLAQWQASEKRDEVLAALAEQIKAIDPKADRQ